MRLKLKAEYAAYDAEIVFDEILPKTELNDHKMCICGDILKRTKPSRLIVVFLEKRVRQPIQWDRAWFPVKVRVLHTSNMAN